MTRRQLLLAIPALAAAAPQAFTKSITSIIFAKEMPHDERFRQVKSAGFDAMEMTIGENQDIPLTISRDDARRLGDTARKSGIAIASLWVSQPLGAWPLNADSAETRERGVVAIRTAIRIATDVSCGALLLYPGRVGSGPAMQCGYELTWQRFTEELKKVIPDAEAAKVLLTPENVWNKFLLSPLEMRTFVDQFHSPWLQTHFDVGNVMQYGYPEDWILTLGSRIKRLHFKDYKLSNRYEQGHFVDLLEGDVNWKAVMAALRKTGYTGFVSPEIGYEPKQADQLIRASRSLDKILAL
jgi:L-ribulose-5-phosphate 3-epimerase